MLIALPPPQTGDDGSDRLRRQLNSTANAPGIGHQQRIQLGWPNRRRVWITLAVGDDVADPTIVCPPGALQAVVHGQQPPQCQGAGVDSEDTCELIDAGPRVCVIGWLVVSCSVS